MDKITIKAGLMALVAVLLWTGLQTQEVSAHPIDSVVMDSNTRNTYFIGFDQDYGTMLRQFSSDTALKTYKFLSPNNVLTADSEDMSYNEGPDINIRDGVIICASETKGTDSKGECSQIVKNEKHIFASAQVFQDLGFNFASTIIGDTSTLPIAGRITSSTQAHKIGTLINDGGTIKLISSNYTTAGIPSMAVLQSWGLSFTDVVPANAADKKLIQVELLPTREAGQIDFAFNHDDKLAESVVALQYFSNLPGLPTKKSEDQTDVKAIAAVNNKISDLTFEQSIPYFTAQSREFISLLPILASNFQNTDEVLKNSTEKVDRIAILGDGTVAEVSMKLFQKGTRYTQKLSLYYKKENGVWKLDLIQSVKVAALELVSKESAVTGSGKTDLELESAKIVKSSDSLSKPSRLEVTIRNKGQTTVNSYSIFAYIEDIGFILDDSDSTQHYMLKPGKSVALSLPVKFINDFNAPAGKYTVEVGVVDNDYSEDASKNSYDNNFLYIDSYFSEPFGIKTQ